MFEDNCDIDFGEDFTLNFRKIENNKRPADTEAKIVVKKVKITPVERKVVERKFPGPAGILPDDRELDWTCLENPNITMKNDEITCSQLSVTVFETSPWLEMSQEFTTLLGKYDVRWIKRNADLNRLPNEKAPFLGAIIKSIECYEGKNSIVKVCLKDPTGEIQGTIIHTLYKQYTKSLVVGSVIVLKQCGVLTTSYSSNHYITIAPHNLVAIYWKNNDEFEEIKIQVIDKESDTLTGEKKFKFKKEMKKENVSLNFQGNCGQISVKTSQEDAQVWQKALEGVDMDSLFGDDF